MIFVAVANLAWEVAHVPLYKLCQTGTAQEIAFAALHGWRSPHRIAGLLMIAIMTGQLSSLPYWLLNAFPVFATIG